jgi:futalosine hydrolase
MKILIVAATHFEIQPLLNQIGIPYNGIDKFISSDYKNLEIDFLITGVGMIETTYHTGKKINGTYDLALNMGICGSFNNNLEIGAVINVVEDCFSELGAEDGADFLTLAELNLKGATLISNTKFKISNPIIELLPKVNGITVNTVHGNESSIEKVIRKFHPITESMEGAAFMYVCENENVSYLQIRAVSNYVERRNKETWNIPLAIKNLNAKIIEVLDSFE